MFNSPSQQKHLVHFEVVVAPKDTPHMVEWVAMVRPALQFAST